MAGPAAKGDADAQFNMGQAAKLGRGMPKDMAKAEDWFHKAARQGHARAADNYGILLFQTGRQSEALPWLNASADRGEPRAMYVLGVAAFNGDFQPKDWVRAYGLMTRAAAVGLPQAIESLKTMNQVIPLEQRQMGASLAADLEARTSDQRARELASAELGVTAPTPALPSPALPMPARPSRARRRPRSRRWTCHRPGPAPARAKPMAACWPAPAMPTRWKCRAPRRPPSPNRSRPRPPRHHLRPRRLRKRPAPGRKRRLAHPAWRLCAEEQRRRAVGARAGPGRTGRASAHRSRAGFGDAPARRWFCQPGRGRARLRRAQGCGRGLHSRKTLTVWTIRRAARSAWQRR
jgi:hypothetical protein